MAISANPNYTVFARFATNEAQKRSVPVIALVQDDKGHVQGVIINENGNFEIPKNRSDFLGYVAREEALLR